MSSQDAALDVTGNVPAWEASRGDEHRLRIAFVVSTVGEWIYRFALPLLVLKLTGSALSTAIMYVVEFLPYIVIGLIAGNVADRADRRRLLIQCNVVSAVIVGIIAFVAAAGSPPVLLLFAIGFLLSSVRPVYFPAFQGFIVERVAQDRRPIVNAWVQGTDSTLNLLGPVIGVGIVIWMGPAVACAVNGVCFAVSALLIATMARRSDGPAWPKGVWANMRTDFVAGLRVLVGIKPLLWGTILMTVTNFAVMAVEANLAYLVAGPTAASGSSLAMVFAAQGAGALAAASLAPVLIRRISIGKLLSIGMFLLAVALLLPGLVPGIAMLTAAWLLAGAATSLIVVPWFTWRQSAVPTEVIGRVTSVSRALSYLTMPAGAVFGSWILIGTGPHYLFLIPAAIQALVWIGVLASPLAKATSEAT